MQAPDEWTLSYPGTSITWGRYSSGVMLADEPVISAVEHLTDDTPRPRGDGRQFGLDYRGATTVTFELKLLGDSEAEVRQRRADLAKVWRADVVRSTPGAVAALSRMVDGRPRVAYGRPRRFAPTGKYARQGVLEVIADFAMVDDCWYDPQVEQLAVPLVPPPSGGLVAPLTTPLTTTPPVAMPGAIVVGGDLPAWPVITFFGPVLAPAVQVTGLWTLALDLNIPAGQSITVDTRPWRRTVLSSDGGSFAGAVTRGSVRLAKASIPPGEYEVALRGQDVSGTAHMNFAWQNTYADL